MIYHRGKVCHHLRLHNKEFGIAMKDVATAFFVLFYVSSTYAAGQIRTTDLIRKLQSYLIVQNCGPVVTEHSKSYDNLPRYREAKKAPNELGYPPTFDISLSTTTTGTFLESQPTAYLNFAAYPSHSRAPPRI